MVTTRSKQQRQEQQQEQQKEKKAVEYTVPRDLLERPMFVIDGSFGSNSSGSSGSSGSFPASIMSQNPMINFARQSAVIIIRSLLSVKPGAVLSMWTGSDGDTDESGTIVIVLYFCEDLQPPPSPSSSSSSFSYLLLNKDAIGGSEEEGDDFMYARAAFMIKKEDLSKGVHKWKVMMFKRDERVLFYSNKSKDPPSRGPSYYINLDDEGETPHLLANSARSMDVDASSIVNHMGGASSLPPLIPMMTMAMAKK